MLIIIYEYQWKHSNFMRCKHMNKKKSVFLTWQLCFAWSTWRAERVCFEWETKTTKKEVRARHSGSKYLTLLLKNGKKHWSLWVFSFLPLTSALNFSLEHLQQWSNETGFPSVLVWFRLASLPLITQSWFYCQVWRVLWTLVFKVGPVYTWTKGKRHIVCWCQVWTEELEAGNLWLDWF